MCDQTQNFSLSIKLVDKNHIIYNKKATKYTKSIQFDERKKKKNLPARLQVGQRGERNNIANNCKICSRNNETPKNYVYIIYIVGILGCEEDDMNKKKLFR